MSYASLADLRDRTVDAYLTEIASEDGRWLDEVRAGRALADAAAEIDSYLQDRYVLPIVTPPPVLVRVACDIALYRLLGHHRTDDIAEARRRYDDAVAWLDKVVKGEIKLGAPAAGGPV